MSREHLEEARDTFNLIRRTTQEGLASHYLATIGSMTAQALLDIDANEANAEAWQEDAREALEILDRLPA